MFLRSAVATMIAGAAAGNQIIIDVLNQNREVFETMAIISDFNWDRAIYNFTPKENQISADEMLQFLEDLGFDQLIIDAATPGI